MKRDHIRADVLLAAALLQLVDKNGVRLIPHEHAKLMTADQIISLYQRDHYPIRKADGGPDEPWNITWTGIMAHRHKTATKDIPEVAKQKRIREREAKLKVFTIIADTASKAIRAASRELTRSKWPTGRKLQSRGFDKEKGRRFVRRRPSAK